MSVLPTHTVEDVPTIEVGVKVVKHFEDEVGDSIGWHRGHVVDIDSDEDDGTVLYHIQYEDGGQEDMTETECRHAMFMCDRIGQSSTCV